MLAPTLPGGDVQLLSIACNYYRSPATIIDRLQLLSIARNYYRSLATIIDRSQLLSIAHHCYRSRCNANRVHNLLIMIIAVGERVRRRRTLSPLPLFDYHYYSIIFLSQDVLTKSTPF
jgi:hypothetical protein